MSEDKSKLQDRLSRESYAIYFIGMIIANVVLNLFVSSSKTISPIVGIIYFVYLVIFFMKGVERCHDLGKNGLWQLIPFYVLFMLFEKGEVGNNEYGKNPEEENYDEDEYCYACQNCKVEIFIDATEKSQRKFICPECKKENIF